MTYVFCRLAPCLLTVIALAACGRTPPDAAAPLLVPTGVPTAAPTVAPTVVPTVAPATASVPTPPAPIATAAPATTQPAPSQSLGPVAQPGTLAPLRFQVVADQSKATFRVREQLARLQAPSDAVGSTGKVSGTLVLNPDGTFDQAQSKVMVNVSDLRTDDQLRDGFIKRTTLETQRYPNAEFVPARAVGLPVPIPADGEHAFQLVGPTTIHGVRKDLTWDVAAKREANQLTGTATTSFKFGDFGMRPPQAAVVLSVVDEIRLEVLLVATQVT